MVCPSVSFLCRYTRVGRVSWIYMVRATATINAQKRLFWSAEVRAGHVISFKKSLSRLFSTPPPLPTPVAENCTTRTVSDHNASSTDFGLNFIIQRGVPIVFSRSLANYKTPRNTAHSCPWSDGGGGKCFNCAV